MPKYEIKSYDDFLKLMNKLDAIKDDQIVEETRKYATVKFVTDVLETFVKQAKKESEEAVDKEIKGKKRDEEVKKAANDIIDKKTSNIIGQLATSNLSRYLENGKNPSDAFDDAVDVGNKIFKNGLNFISYVQDDAFYNLYLKDNINNFVEFSKEVNGEELTLQFIQKNNIMLSDEVYKIVTAEEKVEVKEEVVENVEAKPEVKEDVIDTSVKNVEENEEVAENDELKLYDSEYIDDDNYERLQQRIKDREDTVKQNYNILTNQVLEGARLQEQLQNDERYQNLLAEKKQADRDRNLFNSDRRKLEEIFAGKEIGTAEFNEVFAETVARLAKTNENTKYPLNNAVFYRKEMSLNYKFATEFLISAYKRFEDPTGLKMNEGFIPNLDSYAENVEKDYGGYTMKELDKRIEARTFIDAQFGKCTNQQEYQAKFSSLIDDVLDGKMEDNPLFKNCKNLQRTTSGIGKAAGEIIKLMQNSYERQDSIAFKYGLSSNDIKNICDAKLDGELVSQELESTFKQALGQRGRNELSNAEKAAIDNPDTDKNSPIYKVANAKLNGVEANKNQKEILKDALAVYSRMKEIHEKRGSFFWLLHPVQNLTEYFAIGRCETQLKEQYGFTKNDLQEIINVENRNGVNDVTYKKDSIDGINQACVLSVGKEAYNNYWNAYEQRRELREEAINAPMQENNINNDNDINIEINNDKNLSLHEDLEKVTNPEMVKNNDDLKSEKKERETEKVKEDIVIKQD